MTNLLLPHLQHVFGTWQTQQTADRAELSSVRMSKEKTNYNKC